ncbi:hypothetical protein P3T76_007147 [Phytophthora citrophthora]|uniref:Crinkler effector protein N-terminal domain-containing protein n=1 Tax=Phytophthora citrophthora TaxID=4793 RepID=A0AAD9GNT0_9STRA|nr:hypothetical protein P3T76_007147 [Phytophthora citrophthora]
MEKDGKSFCVVVGAARGEFNATINSDASVFALKKAIMIKGKGLITAPFSKVQLFLTKKDNGWLPSTHLAVLQESKENVPVGFERMPLTDDAWLIQEVLDNNKLPDPRSRQIHVLVVVPDGRKRFQPDMWFDEPSQPLKTRRLDEGVKDDVVSNPRRV